MTHSAPTNQTPSPNGTTPTNAGTVGDDVYTTRLDTYVGTDRLGRLHDRLATTAHRSLDVVWTTHETSLGPLLLAFHDEAVVRVAFESEGFDAVLDHLGERLGARTLRASKPADALRRQLDSYLSGELHEFTVPHSLVLSSAPFRREVQQSLPHIPYGHTASYAEVAVTTGRPKAVRAVGTACATNPLPIVLPCHRVVRSDGGLGNYLGGLPAKRHLLDLEGAHLDALA